MESKKRLTKSKKESKKFPTIKWFNNPEPKDFPASLSYLSLIFDPHKAHEIVEKLKTCPIVHFKAKDIFRASNLPILGNSQLQVERNLKKISKGKKLSPILLVRDTKNGKVIIADGYHRVVTCYKISENVIIPCKIV